MNIEAIRDCFDLALLRYLIIPENLRHFHLNKFKTNINGDLLTRIIQLSVSLLVFALVIHWLLAVLSFV